MMRGVGEDRWYAGSNTREAAARIRGTGVFVAEQAAHSEGALGEECAAYRRPTAIGQSF